MSRGLTPRGASPVGGAPLLVFGTRPRSALRGLVRSAATFVTRVDIRGPSLFPLASLIFKHPRTIISGGCAASAPPVGHGHGVFEVVEPAPGALRAAQQRCGLRWQLGMSAATRRPTVPPRGRPNYSSSSFRGGPSTD